LNKIVNPEGLQESYPVEIGGIQQWVFVRGQNRHNPIILFVHGGPASPMSAALWMYQKPMEEFFTFIHWDQRGA
jgi:pimeloyl-ACP methyl ester carboxylesterase